MKKSQKLYVMTEGVEFRKTPDSQEDAEIMAKGQKLIFQDGPWVRVLKDGVSGYVYEEVTSIVSPEMDSEGAISFAVGHVNSHDSDNTIAVRKMIHDEFGFRKTEEPLTCGEYVLYRLKTKLGVKVAWPSKEGREPAKWANIFQTSGTYQVLDAPVENSVMCFLDGVSDDPAINAIGHVAFVESVLPDNSVEISEADWPKDGKYNERLITKNQWQKKYKAKFIKFN